MFYLNHCQQNLSVGKIRIIHDFISFFSCLSLSLSPLWEMVQEGIDIKSIKWTQHWVALNTWSVKPCCGCENLYYKAWLGCHTSLDLILLKNTHNFVSQFWRIERVSEDYFKVHLYEFQGLQRCVFSQFYHFFSNQLSPQFLDIIL